MSSNRRIGTRNRFEFKRNYIIPLVCIIITCISIITSTVIVINVKNEANNFAVNTNTNIVQSSEELKFTPIMKMMILHMQIGLIH